MKPLCVDLYSGLGGWTEGFLAEGYRCVGFDIEQHIYGEHQYPAELVIQDVRTIHGKQFKDATIIVASSPCQEFSYMAMPWTRAKQIAKALRGQGAFPEGYTGSRTIAELNELFWQPRRIQLEAIEAAGGRFIPLIQENVKGAQPWVGKAQWHYGSFYLWGDVPALMPVIHRGGVKVPGMSWSGSDKPGYKGVAFNDEAVRQSGVKVGGKSLVVNGNRQIAEAWRSKSFATAEGVKQAGISGPRTNGKGNRWFSEGAASHGSKSSARKAASAAIAKIPLQLARHIAQVYASLHPKVAQ